MQLIDTRAGIFHNLLSVKNVIKHCLTQVILTSYRLLIFYNVITSLFIFLLHQK